MSKVSHLPKSTPAKELPFKIKVRGSTHTKHTYEGDFVVKVPSVREMSQIGIELARINDGVPLEMLDKNTAALNNAIAYLKVTLKSGPKWFMNSADNEDEEGMEYGLDTEDVNIPVAVFREANRKVQDWKDSLKGQPDETTSETSGKS